MERSVTIFAFGSAGDTRPLVALGQGLRRRGVGVRVLAAARYADLVEGAGLEHVALDVDPMEVVNTDEGREWLSSRNPVSLLRGFYKVVGPMAERLMEQALESATGSDAVLAPATGFVGHHVGQYLRIPHVLLHLQPGEPTRTAANPLIASGHSLGAPLNLATYEIVEQVTWQLARRIVNPWRRARLGLPPIRGGGPFRAMRHAGVPVLAGFSPSVVPRPRDWPATVHQTGYWFLDSVPAGDPAPAGVAPELVRFLADGPPPVYVGFGSMVPKDPPQVWAAVQDALRRAGVRGVLLGDPDTGTLPGGVQDPDRVCVVRSVDHGWLFPRTAAVVHHGGAGTTAAGLRAGVPSVICPFFSDQPFWGARVHALGAGPEPLPIGGLTAGRLAERISRTLRDGTAAGNARTVARQMAAEDGTGRAAGLVSGWLGPEPAARPRSRPRPVSRSASPAA